MSGNVNSKKSSAAEEKEQCTIKALIYNEKLYDESGEFVSAWLSFPTTQEAVQAALQEIGVDGKNYSRYSIDERESDIKGLTDCIPDNADIDELNYLAIKIQDVNESSLDIFGAIIDKNSRNLTVAELINAIDNVDCYDLQPAFSAKEYGKFLMDINLDEIGLLANKKITDADAYGVFMSRLDEIEKYIDTEEYGRVTAAAEGGKFTDFGYLTRKNDITEHYGGKDNIPPEYKVFAYPDEECPAGLYKIENADLTDFVYKLHIYGGNLISQAANNIPLLSDGGGEDYIVHLRHTEIRISGSESVYHDNSDSGGLIKSTYGHTKAFMLHVDSMENNRAFGSVVMVDCGALAEDIQKNTISYISVTAYQKDGGIQDYSRGQWENLILREKDNIEKQTFNFNSDDVLNLRNHRQEFFSRCLQEATEITPNALLDMLNTGYMELANQPQSGMIRVPLETAKNMLLHSDGPVYRLMPHKPEQLTAITAAKNGLMFPQYRDFAVKRDDRAGIDKLCKREADLMAVKRSERDTPQKRDKSQSL